jgi:hypothetical protein
MRYAIAFLALALAACGPREPVTLASTPAMVSVCYANGEAWQRVVDRAQAHCAMHRKNAVLIPGEGQCGTIQGQAFTAHFRCE